MVEARLRKPLLNPEFQGPRDGEGGEYVAHVHAVLPRFIAVAIGEVENGAAGSRARSGAGRDGGGYAPLRKPPLCASSTSSKTSTLTYRMRRRLLSRKEPKVRNRYSLEVRDVESEIEDALVVQDG